MANRYTIGYRYRKRLDNKTSPLMRRQFENLGGPTPGWLGDTDRRRFRFDKWCKRPQKAISLYWRLRSNTGVTGPGHNPSRTPL